jgi:hypothetical protein
MHLVKNLLPKPMLLNNLIHANTSLDKQVLMAQISIPQPLSEQNKVDSFSNAYPCDIHLHNEIIIKVGIWMELFLWT